jgi:hypothetical protein
VLFSTIQQWPLEEANVVVLIVGTAAVVMLMLNIRTITADVSYRPRMLPARVLEDEAELHPTAEAQPSSPWEAVGSREDVREGVDENPPSDAAGFTGEQ